MPRVWNSVRLLLPLFLLASVFAAQVNPFAGGAPVKLGKAGGKYIVATESSLRVFSEDGELEGMLSVPGITDFAVSGGVLVLTSSQQDAPNVRAFSFPGLEPEWNFTPAMEVFDLSLVWTERETRSWRVLPIRDGFGIASGYTLYIISTDGKLRGNFTAGSDIWDFAENDGYWLATQEGAVYHISRDMELVEKRKVCRDYVLREQLSNRTMGTYTRSVWTITGSLAAACEDGYIHFLGSGKSYRLKRLTDRSLYSYYYSQRRESGYGSPMFGNIRTMDAGGYTVAWSGEKVAVFREGELLWEKGMEIAALDAGGGKLYVLSEASGGKGSLKEYDLRTGELLKERKIKQLECKNPQYRLLGEDGLVASNCEVQLAGRWYFPGALKADFLQDGEFTLVFMDNGRAQYDNPKFHAMLALNGSEVLWSYRLPFELAYSGYLTMPAVGERYVVAAYRGEERGRDRLVVIDRNTGEAVIRNATSWIYGGGLDRYLRNESLVKFVENYSFSALESIPPEVKYGGYDFRDYDELQLLSWLRVLSELPAPAKVIETLRWVIPERKNYLMRREIRTVETCDYNGDGTEDFLVNAGDYFVVLDGSTLDELAIIDGQKWRYTALNLTNYTAPWFNNGIVLCFDDFSGDGRAELVVLSWEGNVSLIEGGRVRWTRKYGNLDVEMSRKIGDIDSDGVENLLIHQWVEDGPAKISLINPRDGFLRFQFPSNQYFLAARVGDANGDGMPENVVVYDDEGAHVVVFSPRYKFELDGSELWQTMTQFGTVMPVTVVDGKIIVGISRRWNEAASALAIFDGTTKELDRVIPLSGRVEDELDWNEWRYFPELRKYGKKLAFFAPGLENEEGGQYMVYDYGKGEQELLFSSPIKRTFLYGGSLGLIGASGEVYVFSLEEFPAPEVSVDGPEVRIRTDSRFYTRVYVDDLPAFSGRAGEITLRLPNGKHRLATVLMNQEGLQRVFPSEIETFSSTDLGFLNKLLLALLAIAAAAKVVKKWK